MFTEVVLFFIILFGYLWMTNRKPANLPPGDWGYPIIGSMPGGRDYYLNLLDGYKKKYGGGLYCSKIGSRIVLFITEYEILKKALFKIEFAGRPPYSTVRAFGDFLGISMASGEIWHTNRRFAMKNLRDFGMGKSKMEIVIHREINSLLDNFRQRLNVPIEVDWAINVSMLNIIWALTADCRFELDDPEMVKFSRLSMENFRVLQGRVRILDFYPITTYLPKIIKDKVLQAEALENNKRDFKDYLMKYIQPHIEKLDKENPRDYIDMYLIDALENKDPNHAFKSNMLNLVNVLVNFFTGSETTSATFKWFINMMAKHQEIQKKAQKIIDEVVPKDRLPSLQDKEQLAYVEACVYESARIGSVITYSIPHATMAEVELEGYTIPKGVVVFPCIEQCHNDPKYWKYPNKFYPEHFLDEQGNLNSNADGYTPFSIGKRQCPGKTLADMDLYIYAATILQQFTITPADGEHITYESEKSNPFVNFPVSHKLIFSNRI